MPTVRAKTEKSHRVPWPIVLDVAFLPDGLPWAARRREVRRIVREHLSRHETLVGTWGPWSDYDEEITEILGELTQDN